MAITSPRGVKDIIGADAVRMRLFENSAKEILQRRGFEEIILPVFEDLSLFVRSIGETTDIVGKEMYVFEDKKGKKFALRPEGTASIARAFIEHNLILSSPAGKFFYSGEMFRYERPQSGRYRQFHQIGAEFFGNSSPSADAEIIIAAADILKSAQINSFKIALNSLGCLECRSKFRKVLIEYFSSFSDLCADCKIRIEKNPLRVLDCKIDSSKFENAPKIADILCPSCKENFESAQNFLNIAGYDFEIDNRLVRGLDYYTRMVFEIRSDALGAQDALAAGGRYDNLIKDLGGAQTAAVGFALGTERVILASQNLNPNAAFAKPEKIVIAYIDEELFPQAFAFSIKLSQSGLNGNKKISVFPPAAGKNLSSQLKFADKIGADKTFIFAKTEFENQTLILKNMKDKTQSEVKISSLI